MTAHAKARWKLEDAKARFSELVRRAESDGPQTVTVRGREAVVVLSAEQFGRLSPAEPRIPLVEFLAGLDLTGLDLERPRDLGRDVEL
jgi:antitoxin Phd